MSKNSRLVATIWCPYLARPHTKRSSLKIFTVPEEDRSWNMYSFCMASFTAELSFHIQNHLPSGSSFLLPTHKVLVESPRIPIRPPEDSVLNIEWKIGHWYIKLFRFCGFCCSGSVTRIKRGGSKKNVNILGFSGPWRPKLPETFFFLFAQSPLLID